MKITFTFLLVILFLGTLFQIRADTIDQRMPGHSKKDQDFINPTIDIVVAKFIALGNGSADEVGATYYERAQVQITSTLQGALSGNIKVSFTARSFPKNEKDALPALNTEYILFIRDQKIDPDDYELEKILPATDQNIARIKSLIAAAPSSK
jgi:hypothetical protein